MADRNITFIQYTKIIANTYIDKSASSTGYEVQNYYADKVSNTVLKRHESSMLLTSLHPVIANRNFCSGI